MKIILKPDYGRWNINYQFIVELCMKKGVSVRQRCGVPGVSSHVPGLDCSSEVENHSAISALIKEQMVLLVCGSCKLQW